MAMNEKRRKELERLVFDTWSKARPELGIPKTLTDESPDFLVTWGAVRVGVEVTTLAGYSFQQGSAVGKLFQTIEDGLKATAQPVVVSAHLKAHLASTRRAVVVGKEVLSLIQPVLAMPGAEATFSRRAGARSLAPELLEVEVHRPAGLPRPVVLLGGMGFCVVTAFQQEIRRTLEAKASKLERYLQRCDRCWLLIDLPHSFEVVDGMGRTPVLAETYETGFERVFLVSPERSNAWELMLQEPT